MVLAESFVAIEAGVRPLAESWALDEIARPRGVSSVTPQEVDGRLGPDASWLSSADISFESLLRSPEGRASRELLVMDPSSYLDELVEGRVGGEGGAWPFLANGCVRAGESKIWSYPGDGVSTSWKMAELRCNDLPRGRLYRGCVLGLPNLLSSSARNASLCMLTGVWAVSSASTKDG